MNIIRMPPIKSIENRIGNHTCPLVRAIVLKTLSLATNKTILTLTGLHIKIIVNEEAKVRILIKFKVIIFLSLIKISILDIEDLGKIESILLLFFYGPHHGIIFF